ncbi:hypothetical protein AGABI2DRAFT_120121 [Agaricus bisporus var. bisporus H97]|uniref:hypothetical protein n=1 Tax=Agaricus bisporus var. bisporus (strain H97 / ATCC MYA-4626 / FGSC 10389) TaxID=936046 RepID=UPI00029F529B|nr:hypothetical protein AGABI2DRAFT_120121 [Agaricus bisporus var. bisporus H97]EKV45156.1 hypothetical protein AGABI2DRAFT_120121 [Agaricus bisporus var. bisporus H97]
MSAGGFEANHAMSTYQRYTPRKSSGTFTAPNFNRPYNHPPRRRTPSPPPHWRPPYDSYTPERVVPPFRDENPNAYRPNVYRPEYAAAEFWDPPPSPDPYLYSPRSQDIDTRESTNPWHPPAKNQSSWQDRKSISSSPTRDRPRRDDLVATRIFEPSDAWKRDHFDRPARFDGPNHSDRYSQHRRESTSSIQDRSQRANRNFVAPSSGGDRYRPAQDHFHLHQTPRPEYDSYRPPYEDSWTSPLRESISAPVHHRSPSYSHQRGGQTDSRAGGPLVSPKAFNRFPMRRRRGLSFSYNNDRNFHSADQLNYGSDSYHADHADHADDDEYRSYNSISRASSRSSIASTIPSERHDESPDTIVAESSTSVQNTREAIETFKDPTRSPAPCAPPSPCPPGLPSLNDSVSIEHARIKSGAKDDVREENEVKEILSQDQIKIDAEQHDQNHMENGKPNDLARQASHCEISPSLWRTPNSDGTGRSNSTVDAPSATPQDNEMAVPASPAARHTLDLLPPTKSLSTLLPDERSESNNEIVVNESHRDTVHEVRRSAIEETAPQVPVMISLPSAEDITITPTSTPCIRRTTPETPLSEPPASITSVENVIDGDLSIKEGLRVAVKARLLHDRQRSEELVNSILLANTLVSQHDHETEEADAEGLVREVLLGSSLQERIESFNRLRGSLVQFITQRQTLIHGKVNRLRQEYAHLQDQWNTHCHILNEQSKPSILEGETMPIGRTTRRSANLGDVVRSDLEMDQILASLENNDATDPNHLSQRNLATIPDMISVINGQIDHLFDETNHRVENPAEYYGPITGIDDWTAEEKEIFLDRYAAYPKQFGIIAESLPNKTSSQCVDYYYLHKKGLIDFRKVVSKFGPKRRRRGGGKRKGNALLTDIQKHDEEVHRGSGLISTAPSRGGRRKNKEKEKEKEIEKDVEMETEDGDGEKEKTKDKEKDKGRERDNEKEKEGTEPKVEREKRRPGRPPNKRTMTQMQSTPTETPTPEPENKSRRKRGVNGTAAGSSSVTPIRLLLHSSLEKNKEATPESDHRPAKRTKRARKVKSAAIVEDEPSTPEMDSQTLPDVSVSALALTEKLTAKGIDHEKNRWPSQSITTPS